MTDETTLGYVFRCKCGFAKRYDYTAFREVKTVTKGKAPFLRQAKVVQYRFGAAHRRPEMDVRCDCGRTMQYRQIEGTTTEHVCNAKCRASKGHVCECSCGGANHGRDL